MVAISARRVDAYPSLKGNFVKGLAALILCHHTSCPSRVTVIPFDLHFDLLQVV